MSTLALHVDRKSEKHGNTAVSNQSERAPKRSGRLS